MDPQTEFQVDHDNTFYGYNFMFFPVIGSKDIPRFPVLEHYIDVAMESEKHQAQLGYNIYTIGCCKEHNPHIEVRVYSVENDEEPDSSIEKRDWVITGYSGEKVCYSILATLISSMTTD